MKSERSTAVTEAAFTELRRHLLRPDGQEDLCFATWHPSTGMSRESVILDKVILPRDGERQVHGNASFMGNFFARALGEAMKDGAGLAFLHSHPMGRRWQGMSEDDVAAEQGIAGQVLSATEQPIVGLTMAGDGALSSRIWNRVQGGWRKDDCTSVRVVGSRLEVTAKDRRDARALETHVRTVSAWGEEVQGRIASLRVGVVGVGSVGAIVAEALARVGVEQLKLIDFDSVKMHNLDRLLHASRRDVRLARSKVEVLAKALRRSASAQVEIEEVELSVGEPEGFRQALDCDVLFSCVDRPWPRHVLNLIAYSHLIPVIDGGIRVGVRDGLLKGADWKAHVAAHGRKCLECLEQYDSGLVEVERRGLLDDPRYIEGLPHDHALRRNENVFPFSLSVASLEVLQWLLMIVAPSGIGDIGAQAQHFVTGGIERDESGCREACPYSSWLSAQGDDAPVTVVGQHARAEEERTMRRVARRRLGVRMGRRIEDTLNTLLSK